MTEQVVPLDRRKSRLPVNSALSLKRLGRKMKKIITSAILIFLVVGCTKTSVIQPAATSKSMSDNAIIFTGETVKLDDVSPGGKEFRLLEQGATGFVPVSSLQEHVAQRATAFCDGMGKAMKPLRESTSKPPHIFGNFPRAELVFECIDKSDNKSDKYTRLINLKKLLDNGAITQEEFDHEKGKILSDK